MSTSEAAHSWGYSGDDADDQIAFFDEPEGLRVWMLRYGAVRNGRAEREELAVTIPVAWVPSLIRSLVTFAGEGELAKEAQRRGLKS